MKRILCALVLTTAFASATALAPPLHAAEYLIDTEGAHASIQFRIQHLGFSWLTGRFNAFDGLFTWDADDPEASRISVTIDTRSVDSNHAERDRHLRSDDFLNVGRHPRATFVSQSVSRNEDGSLQVSGDLTLNGITRAISFPAELVGEGSDPWGGYRAGFTGQVSFALKDFGIDFDLGPSATQVELTLDIEGIRQ